MTSKKLKSVRNVKDKKPIEMEPIEDGLYFDMSNGVYHHQHDFDNHYFSSSQGKALLESPEYFYRKYVSKELPPDEMGPHLDVGTAFHTLLLEPELWEEDIAIFTGAKRYGKNWEEFKEIHKGKAIITQKEEELVNTLAKYTKENAAAQHFMGAEGWCEASLFITLYSDGKTIYTKTRTDHYAALNKDGWADGISKEVDKDKLIPLKLKMRFDKLTAEGHLVDLKTTSDNPESKWAIANIEKNYNYSFSAAWYHVLLDAYISWLVLGDECDLPQPQNFYWIYASKKYFNTQVYRCSQRAMAAGRAKVIESLLRLTEIIANGNEKDSDVVQVWDVDDKVAKWYGVEGLAVEEKAEVYDRKSVKTSSQSNLLETIRKHPMAKLESEGDLDDL